MAKIYHTAEFEEKILKYPYSFEYWADLKSSGHSYQIISYGFEHLIPTVLQNSVHKDLSLINNHFNKSTDWEIHLNLEVPEKEDLLTRVNEIKKVYEDNSILTFEVILTPTGVKLTKIEGLKKLKKSNNKDHTAFFIIAYVFYNCSFYKDISLEVYTPEQSFFKEFELQESAFLSKNLDLKNTLSISKFRLDFLKNIFKTTCKKFKLPKHLFYFRTDLQCLLHFLELNFKTDSILMEKASKALSVEIKKQLEAFKKPSLDYLIATFLKVLRSFEIKEHNFLNVCSCNIEGIGLLNPLTKKYCSFCINPFKCILNTNTQILKENCGYTIINKVLYVWFKKQSKNFSLIRPFKRLLENLFGLKILQRKKNALFQNQIYLGNAYVGVFKYLKGLTYLQLDLHKLSSSD